jgi:DNA-binding XRE family transcriptional regulator
MSSPEPEKNGEPERSMVIERLVEARKAVSGDDRGARADFAKKLGVGDETYRGWEKRRAMPAWALVRIVSRWPNISGGLIPEMMPDSIREQRPSYLASGGRRHTMAQMADCLRRLADLFAQLVQEGERE